MSAMGTEFTHLDEKGAARMVDVSSKNISSRTADRTGVEMEALTSVTVTALALVDMVKAVDPAAVIINVQVEEKTGGKTGIWRRSASS